MALLLVAAAAFVPYGLWLSLGPLQPNPLVWWWVAKSIQLLFEGLLTAVVASALSQALLAGSRHGLPSPRAALARLPASLPIIAVQAALLLLSVVVVNYLFWRVWKELGPVLSYAMVLLVALLSVVPQVLWFVAVPVAVVERRGFLGSLRRSAELVRGRRLAIFVLWSLVAMLGSAVAALTPVISTFHFEVNQPAVAVQTALLALIGALDAVIRNVVHRELRRERDGADPDEAAAVFD